MVGIGGVQLPDSRVAGREVALQSRAGLSGAPGWALAFCGGRHAPEEFLQGFREVYGAIPVVGGAGVGAMTNGMIGATGYECGTAVFPAAFGDCRFLVAPDLRRGERAAGRHLAEQLLPQLAPMQTVLLFYDSVCSASPSRLHVASHFLDGLEEVLSEAFGDARPVVVGAGTLGDFDLTESYVFNGEVAVKHQAVCVVLPRGLTTQTTISHGCTPASSFLEITRIDGPVVYELDGRPAATVLAERLGVTPSRLCDRRVSLALTLGEKQGDPFAPFDEGHYVNRLVIGADPDNGAVRLFEADFRAGTRVQLMVTDAEQMYRSTLRHTQSLLSQPPPGDVVFALYVDCAGRACAFNGSRVEEASIVQTELGGRIPWLGFYSGVEIAPMLGRSRPLDWTGVLTLFGYSERGNDEVHFRKFGVG